MPNTLCPRVPKPHGAVVELLKCERWGTEAPIRAKDLCVTCLWVEQRWCAAGALACGRCPQISRVNSRSIFGDVRRRGLVVYQYKDHSSGREELSAFLGCSMGMCTAGPEATESPRGPDPHSKRKIVPPRPQTASREFLLGRPLRRRLPSRQDTRAGSVAYRARAPNN